MNVSLAYLAALSLAVAAPARDVPPALPDAFHLPDGCVVSTQVYIQKLKEVRPDLHARPLHMTRGDESHVMALVTNRAGEQFARDEYTLVHDLHANERQKLSDDQLAQRALKAHAAAERKNPYTPVGRAESVPQLRAAANKVQTLLPEATVWKTSEGAFATWHGAPGEIFVYAGDRGTMCIEPRKGISEPQLAAALAKNLNLGALQQPAHIERKTATLTR